MGVDLNTTINNAATGAYQISAASSKKSDTANATAAAESKDTGFGEAAVFEKSSGSADAAGSVQAKDAAASAAKDTVKSKSIGAYRTEEERQAVISQLKADQETRQNQLFDIVKQTMQGQGKAFAQASDDDMWKFLADGNFTVDAATKAQAQEDISEDGYWGVKQTSERILDFAKALAGDDPSKADKMMEAFKKGFDEATKTWGKELPDLTKQTYDAVLKGFDDWKNSSKSSDTSDLTNFTTQALSGQAAASSTANAAQTDASAQAAAAATTVQ